MVSISGSGLKKLFVTVAIPLSLAACSSMRVHHNINDECLHKVTDDEGKVLSVEFDKTCGDHKRDLATAKIDAETQQALQEIQATQTAELNIIKEEKTKIFWMALANRASFEIGNAQQEDTATRLLISARTHVDPEVRQFVEEAQSELGITNEMLNAKNQIWDKIRHAQAEPGIQIVDLGNGELYMDKYKHPYGPLAPKQ